MYEAGIRYILGLKKEGNVLKFEPHVPLDWKEYGIRYKYGESVYNIKVINRSGKCGEIQSVKINGEEQKSKEILLENSGGVYAVEVEI